MSYLDTLLQDVKVEWKALGQVLVRTKGTSITAGQMKILHKDGAPLKIFAGGKTVAFVDYKDIPDKDINREPSVIVKSRGIIEFEYYDKPFSHKNEMWSYHSKNENIDIKFVYHYLRINEPYFQNIGGRMQMPQISTPDTDKFQIPIPPLSVQKEIVRILDSFTELTAELAAELTAELTARKKQYNYYREKLLSFEEGDVEWKTLGEVTKVLRGRRLTREQLSADMKFPVFHGGLEPLGYYGLSNRPANSVMIINVGASAGTVGYSDVDFWSSDGCFCLEHSELLNNKFLYYYLIGKQNFLQSRVRKAGIPTLDGLVVEKLQIPIPPLSEQERIVAILDKFDTLTTSISEGLPKEIELRKKQYEYYRDLLLTFPKN